MLIRGSPFLSSQIRCRRQVRGRLFDEAAAARRGGHHRAGGGKRDRWGGRGPAAVLEPHAVGQAQIVAPWRRSALSARLDSELIPPLHAPPVPPILAYHASHLATCSPPLPPGGLVSGDMARERERRAWEEDAHAEIAAEDAAERWRAERREVGAESGHAWT